MDQEIPINVSKSPVQGRGLFAQKDFKKGELVLGWNQNNKYLTNEEAANLPEDKKPYIAIFNNKLLLIAEPERHMNHSCDPNTQTDENGFDYALRDIKRGEEVTGDYEHTGSWLGFECNCKSENCRKVVRSRPADWLV